MTIVLFQYFLLNLTFQMALEVENCFLSASEDKTRLAEMLQQVMQDLNLHKMCTLTGKHIL